MPAHLDESLAKESSETAEQAALELAQAKALAISRERRGEWVIGSDSIASSGKRLFDKPSSREEAAEHLRFFSGRTLHLTSAVALARNGKVDWTHAETADLHVRPLSDDFIQSYLDLEWPQVAGCVGVFRMEGRGVQLFSSVEGSHFTILGLPLLPLLGALRVRGVVAA